MRTNIYLIVASLLVCWGVLTRAAAGDDILSGRYAVSGHRVDGTGYDGELAIQRRGSAFDVSWQRSGSAAESGMGLLLNYVLGVAYWPNDVEQEPGIGMVIYRIDGGVLDGIWLPSGAHDWTPGREVLSGSPDLTGRFQITLGVNPGGRSYYTGYADMTRTGDQVRIVWHTPLQVFVGSGIKIGRVLAVAFAPKLYPAVAIYCFNGRQLEGSWWTGPEGEAGREMLVPLTAGNMQPSDSQPDGRDPCTTPVAANF